MLEKLKILKNKLLLNQKDLDILTFALSTKTYDKTFLESLEFLVKIRVKADFYRDLYYPQLFKEFILKFSNEFDFTDREIKLFISAYNDLKLSFRLALLWYYDAAGKYLRSYFEKNISILFSVLQNKWYEFKKNKQINLRDKISFCMENWQLSKFNLNNKWKDCYNEYYFPWNEKEKKTEVYKIYKYYSEKFIHNWNLELKVEFDKKEFLRYKWLYQITIYYIARLYKVTIWEDIEKYLLEKVDNVVEWWRDYYFNYLKPFFQENWFLSNQYSWWYNMLTENEDFRELLENEIWIKMENIIWKDYIKDQKENEKLWKKVNWDKDKYLELREEKMKKEWYLDKDWNPTDKLK